MCRTGNVSRCIAEPHRKNLFLQSLSAEEHEILDVSEDDSGEVMSSSQRQVQDKDRIESLETDVTFWTDFSKVQYHPRSLYELHSSWMDIQKFDDYGIAKDVLSGGLQLEEMNERLRFFIEESAEVLENIEDEYTNTPVLLYAVRAPGAYTYATNRKSSIARSLHDAVSFSRLSSFCKLMIPVGLPSLRSTQVCGWLYKPFHSSAVYAASIHSISIPFRMEMPGPAANSTCTSGAMDVGEIVHTLAGQSRQNMVTVLDVAMPPPSLTGDHRATVSQVNDSVRVAYQTAPAKPMFSRLSVALCPLPIPLPFPSIFGSNVGRHGELVFDSAQGARSRGSLEIESVPMAARLRSSTAIMPFVEKRLGDLRKHGIARGAPGAELLRTWGFGRDEVEDMGEHLSKLLMAFDPHSHATSDSD
ncbi:hypothetical protein B296_00023023 [Ensete ventricosum]|uniref:DML1/Misato tubulin domain-containing protein n=1 Tax=Ensete ventricosum TaxID=4639 RepID=A0A426Z2E9_ENSVE|nr:hypothetical protein B296_00023023 [Ensete ventricosum]